MIAGFSIGSDNKRYWRGQLPRMAIITIIIMPLFYGAMYLWAFWNPFGEVNKIPAAIVNLDKGAIIQGEKINAGDQLTEKLISSGQLGLTEVSEKAANDGLLTGEYYYTITIPENFSAAIGSPANQKYDPFKAQLKFKFNDANNYLSTIIGQDASEQVMRKVNTVIGEKAVDKVLVKIEDAGSKLEEATNGAAELATGLKKAKSGTTQLRSGTTELQTQLDGIIIPALRGLASDSVKTMNAQASKAVADAERVLQALNRLENSPLSNAVDGAVAILSASDEPGAEEAGRDLERAQADYQRRVAEANQIARSLSSDLRTLESKLNVTPGGSLDSQLAGIESAAAKNLRKLKSGLKKLNSGAGQLNTGMSKLYAGANELHAGLESGLSQVPTWNAAQRAKEAGSLSSPVNLAQKIDNDAPTFGTGFAPFFTSLSLFVGSILCWMLLTPLQSRAVVSGLNPFRAALASYVPAVIIGAMQATVLYCVIRFALGLHATHPVGMWLFMILMSVTFLAMIQAIDAFFDLAIGRVVTLGFLMLQLISAGGIYPVPTTAKPFQILHPYDPMTYTVNGMRQLTVAVSTDSRLPIAILVLVGITVVSLVITALVARRNRQYTMERLYPSITV